MGPEAKASRSKRLCALRGCRKNRTKTKAVLRILGHFGRWPQKGLSSPCVVWRKPFSSFEAPFPVDESGQIIPGSGWGSPMIWVYRSAWFKLKAAEVAAPIRQTAWSACNGWALLFYFKIEIHELYTPEKLPSQKEVVFQPSFFRGELLNLGGSFFWNETKPKSRHKKRVLWRDFDANKIWNLTALIFKTLRIRGVQDPSIVVPHMGP